MDRTYGSDRDDSDEQPAAVRVLLTDGGEDELDEDEEEEDEDEEEDDEDEEEDDEDEEDEDEEDEEEEDEEDEEEEEDEERCPVLFLNLDGLFLDLLGLEVDLDTVTLDISAVPGPNNLLGNLLCAVTGLLDDGLDLGGLLGIDDLLGDNGLLGGGDDEEGEGVGLPGLPEFPELNLGERIRSFASAIAERLRNFLGSVVEELPLEELLTQFIQALVSQLLDGGDEDGENGDGEDGEAAA